jgi:methylated-DNA-[protein]-cysteine S-methyltransferase
VLLLTSQKTPTGELYLISDEQVLLAAGFRSFEDLLTRMDPVDRARELNYVKRIPVISELVSDYFAGDISAFNGISVRQPGGDYFQAVWKAMRKIPAGKAWSYADLAKKAGNPTAIRAAGSACARNLIAPIIPCHRVVKSGGALGNYGYGLPTKEWLLKFEGAI